MRNAVPLAAVLASLALPAAAAQAPAAPGRAGAAAPAAGVPAAGVYRANIPVPATRFPQCPPLASQWLEWSGKQLPRVTYAAQPAAEALDGLSPSYPQEPAPTQPTYYIVILDPDGKLKASDPKISLQLRNVKLAEVVDRICAMAGFVWWLDREVYVTPKESLDKAFAPWRALAPAAAVAAKP